jgi:indoleamine 2,3-dioxygenase
MPEKCDPYIYYHRVRPFIFGTKDNPDLKKGLIYENQYNNKPQFLEEKLELKAASCLF